MWGHYANIAERAVGLTATVRVRGPDPRGDVTADAAFFAHHRPDDDHLPPVVAISATALRIPTRASTRWDGRPAAGDDRERFIAPLAPFLNAPDDEEDDDGLVIPEAGLIKGAWAQEEDDLLMELVQQLGPKKWSAIAARMPGRIGKQVRASPAAHGASRSYA